MKLIIAITGASGSLYAKLLLDRLGELSDRLDEVAMIVSETGEQVWQYELPDVKLSGYPFKQHQPDSFFTPVASGSAGYDAMIVIPCSMGTLGRIAHGVADDLIARAADVILKERKQLILVPREAPYNRIHLQNMLTVTDAGAIVVPASPHFYNNPQSINDLALTVVDRVLKMVGLAEERGFLNSEF